MIYHLVALTMLMTCSLAAATFQQEAVLISGTVSAYGTGEMLRFVRVREPRTRVSVISDRKGRFELRLPSTTDSVVTITFTLLGYATDTLVITKHDTTVQVKLRERALRGAEVLVRAEDPARQIMRRVIMRREMQEKELRSYTYMLYTKFVATTDTTTALRSTGRGDSTIVSILESFSRGYYKYPDNYYNEIVQRRQTVNVPSQANTVSFGTNLNLYDNTLQILGEDIDSPFGSDAIDIYDYSLASSLDDDTVRIDVKPKSPLRRAFSGSIYIDQIQNVPIEVSLQATEAVNLPFNADLLYRQNFMVVDSMVVPEALSIECSLNASLFWVISSRLDIDIESFCYDYSINPTIADYVFDQKRVDILPEAKTYDPSYWKVHAKLPLRPEEELAYQEINSFVNNPDSIESSLLNKYFAPIRKGLAALRRPPFTGFDDIVKYNSIYGPYLGIGLQHDIGGVFETRLTGGYGFNDKHWYYTSNVSIPIDRLEKLQVGLGYSRELLRRDNASAFGQNLVTVTSLIFGNDYGDYYYNTGLTLESSYSWGQLRFLGREQFIRPSSFSLRYASADQQSAVTSNYFHLFPRRDTQRINPTIKSGRMNSLTGELLLDYSPLRRISRRGLQLVYEIADSGILGGDFSFGLLSWQGFVRMPTLPLWTLDLSVAGTWSWGAVPPQRFMSTETSLNGIAVGNAFRGMRVKEFYGDRSFVMTLSHNFGEVVPGVLRIPNVASFGLELILFGGIAWTTFSEATLQAYKPVLKTTAETADKFYYDVGLSINRVLIFLRVDVIARLSQRDIPEIRFAVSNALF